MYDLLVEKRLHHNINIHYTRVWNEYPFLHIHISLLKGIAKNKNKRHSH